MKMAAFGATSPLPCASITSRWFVELTTYAFARRLRASWMEAMVTKVARVSARFSRSLGETPVSSDPREGALDYPAARQDDKALRLIAPLDDRHAQQRHLC